MLQCHLLSKTLVCFFPGLVVEDLQGLVRLGVRYLDSRHVAGVIEVNFPGCGCSGIDYFFCNWQTLRQKGHGGVYSQLLVR